MRLALQRARPLDVVGSAANLFEVLGADGAFARPPLSDQQLDAQPRVELMLLGPDARHLRPRVPLDHLLAFLVSQWPTRAQGRLSGASARPGMACCGTG